MIDQETKEFYDQFWPRNVPILVETRKYILYTISERDIPRALDAGCGHGIGSIVLSDISEHVTAVDISSDSLETAREQAAYHNMENIVFSQQDLQYLDLPDDSFDLVWCWGVAMMAPDPMKVINNLMRVTKPGGVLYLGVYLKTWLSPVHQLVRHFCRKFMNGKRRKKFVLDFFTFLTRLVVFMQGQEINLRPDNISIQTQVEDWYYPPYKTFYSIEKMKEIFLQNGFDAECTQDRLGRVKSATIFVVKGVKKPID